MQGTPQRSLWPTHGQQVITIASWNDEETRHLGSTPCLLLRSGLPLNNGEQCVLPAHPLGSL